MNESKKKRGFAAMNPEQLRQIASAGGVARREAYKMARQSRAVAMAQAPRTDGNSATSTS